MMIIQGSVHLWRLKIAVQKARGAISISSWFGRVEMMDMHVQQMQSVVDHVRMVRVEVGLNPLASSPSLAELNLDRYTYELAVNM